MAKVPVLDSVLTTTILMEQIDAQFAVTKYPARYSLVTPAAASDPITITPSGSPFTYVNQTGSRLEVHVSGGTVSQIAHGRSAGGATVFTNTGATSGPTLLASADQIKITYSAAPTITGLPIA